MDSARLGPPAAAWSYRWQHAAQVLIFFLQFFFLLLFFLQQQQLDAIAGNMLLRYSFVFAPAAAELSLFFFQQQLSAIWGTCCSVAQFYLLQSYKSTNTEAHVCAGPLNAQFRQRFPSLLVHKCTC